MRLRWFGQAAFRLQGREHAVVIDPFGEMADAVRARGMRFAYPPVTGVRADLVLVTHEHFDHNGVEGVAGDPPVVRRAGRHDTPVGPVVGVASEHDRAAGTERGPNAMYRFTLDGLDIAHLGDLGQAALRPEQAAALRGVQVLFIPVGGGPTLDGPEAAAVVAELRPRLVVPMHYATPAVDFLGPLDPFLEAVAAEVQHVDGSETGIDSLPSDPTVLVLRAPDPETP
jgi:L-ascorbate metabolism protein UlaG (beta-lactamase superfamily)